MFMQCMYITVHVFSVVFFCGGRVGMNLIQMCAS